jgi:hypothetical protein
MSKEVGMFLKEKKLWLVVCSMEVSKEANHRPPRHPCADYKSYELLRQVFFLMKKSSMLQNVSMGIA